MDNRIARVDGNIFCEVCGDQVELSEYRVHLRYAHKDIGRPKGESRAKKEFLCHICLKQFTSKFNLDYHLAHHYNLKNFGCDQCSKAYNTQSDLNQHRKQSHGIVRVHPAGSKMGGVKQCPICLKTLSTTHSLNEHMAVHSSDRKTFNCEQCGKDFKHKESLKKHFDVQHLGLKKYTCVICGKAFGKSSDRQKHELIHQKGRTGTYCTFCKKYFEDIQMHDAITHPDFQFQCSECFRKFPSQHEVDRHKALKHLGSDYLCDLCGCGFDNLYKLRCHMKVHTEESEAPKSLDCSTCGKHFSTPYKLTRHILCVHEKVRDFECEICLVRFRDRRDLNHHKSKKHGLPWDSKTMKPKPTKMPKEKKKRGRKNVEVKEETLDEGMDYDLDASGFVEIKQEPTETLNESTDIFEINIKQEKRDESDFEVDNLDDEDWTETKQENASSDEFLQPPKKKQKIEVGGFLQRIIDKYPAEKDGKRLQVRCKLCCVVFNTILEYKDHFMENHGDLKERSYECKECILNFEDRKEYHTHFRNFHKNFNCTQCRSQFPSQHQLSKHMEKDHKDDNSKLICSLCGKFYTTQKNLDLHFNAVHQKIQYPCEMCDKTFTFKSAYYKHRQNMHMSMKKAQKCTKCNFKSKDPEIIKTHFEKFHKDMIECLYCNEKFNVKSQLEKHHRENHDRLPMKFTKRCPYCDEIFKTLDRADRHVAQVHFDGKRPLRHCGYCQVDIEKFEEYQQHISLHEGVYICVICGDPHYTPQSLAQHKKIHDVEEKNVMRFCCDYCGLRTYQKNALKIHMAMHATAPELFTCDICGKSFKFYSSMYTHRLYHLEPTVPCPECDKKFVTNKDKELHIRREHTQERPFSCPVCNESFFTKPLLKNHLQRHPQTMEIFGCEICNISFGNKKKDLDQHDGIFHPEKRPFRCFICDVTFRFQNNLDRHNRDKHRA